MSSFFQTVQTRDGEAADAAPVVVSQWMVVLGCLAGVLVLGGVVTAAVGLNVVGRFDGTVLGNSQTFDEGVAVAIVGGAAIVLGIVVGTAWLVLGVIRSDRRR